MSHRNNRRIRAALFATAITAGVGGAAVIASGASAADAVSATAAVATVDTTDTTAMSSTDSSATDSSTVDSSTADSSTADSSTADSSTVDPAEPARDPSQGGHQANGITETLLTGDTAASVTSAAQAAYPDATIERVDTDAEGDTYEAHMVLADGSHITLKFDAAFTITSTDTGGPQGGGPAPAAATGA